MKNQSALKSDADGMINRAISSSDNTSEPDEVRAAKINAAGRIAAAYVEAQSRVDAAEKFAETLAKAMRD